MGRFIPTPPLECIAGVDGSEGISHLESLGLGSLNLVQFIEHTPGLSVLRALQVGINQIVHCVKLLIKNTGQMVFDCISLRRRLGIEI